MPSPSSQVRGLYARFRLLLHEVAKFGIVGLVGFVVDVGVSNGLHHGSGMGPLKAKVVSTVLAALVTYVGNRYWSFRHRVRSPISRDLPLFFVLNAVGLGIALACIGFTYYVLGYRGALAYNVAGNLIGTGLGTVFRFYTYKKWVFRHPDAVAGLSDAERERLDSAAVVQV